MPGSRSSEHCHETFLELAMLLALAFDNLEDKHMKSIALVAHDGKKAELLSWVQQHAEFFKDKQLHATGTTGRLISQTLQLSVNCLASGPLGGDQQIGALIAEQQIDWLVFFWDPLSSQPHDPDVKALIRLAVVWNIPVACNKATADFIVHSSLMQQDYQRAVPDFTSYLGRATG
jgi:methylglyoxal synthase